MADSLYHTNTSIFIWRILSNSIAVLLIVRQAIPLSAVITCYLTTLDYLVRNQCWDHDVYVFISGSSALLSYNHLYYCCCGLVDLAFLMSWPLFHCFVYQIQRNLVAWSMVPGCLLSIKISSLLLWLLAQLQPELTASATLLFLYCVFVAGKYCW